jgi:ABC-type oligopeptide transport system substrate-binding subunit
MPTTPDQPAAARALRTALALLLAVAVAGCGDPPPRTLVRTGLAVGRDPTLVVWPGPAGDLHPHRAAPQLVAALHAPLVTSNPVTRLPGWGPDAPAALVESITSEDLRRWELSIKAGWRWHDGTPVTAGDLERGWRAAIEAGLAPASAVTDVRATDDLTLAFALRAPFGQLPHLLTHQAFLPLPPAAATSDDEAERVGTGPYRITGRDGDRLHLAAVDGHPTAGDAGVDRLDVLLAPAPDVEVDLAIGADGDLEPPGGPGAVSRTRVVRLPGRQLAHLGLPLTDPGFTDPAVRLALSHAIDRDRLVARFDGAVIPADRLVGPGFARATDVTCTACAYDADRAAELWPDDRPGPLTIWYAADAGHEDVIRALAEGWRRVLGIQDIQLASAPAPELVDRITATDVDGPFRLTWQADVSSPVRLLEPLFGPRGSANDTRFRSDELEDLLAAAGADRDLVGSLATYGAAEQLVLDRMPVIPLWFSTVPVASRPGVGGIVLDGEGRLDWVQLRS